MGLLMRNGMTLLLKHGLLCKLILYRLSAGRWTYDVLYTLFLLLTMKYLEQISFPHDSVPPLCVSVITYRSGVFYAKLS